MKKLKSLMEKAYHAIIKGYMDNFISLLMGALDMNGDSHPEMRLVTYMRSKIELITPIILLRKYNREKLGLTTNLLFNKTALAAGFTKKKSAAIDIIATLANGTKVAFEFDTALHLVKLVKTCLCNDALVEEIITRCKSKLESIKNTKASHIYVLLTDSPVNYGGEDNLRKIISTVNNKHCGITLVNMTQYSDAIFSKNSSASTVYSALERMRAFVQYLLNITNIDKNYYKVDIADISGAMLAHYLYVHPERPELKDVLLNVPTSFTTENELVQYFDDNNIPRGIGYCAVPPTYVERLQSSPVKHSCERSPKVIKLEGVGYKMLVAAKRSKGK